MANVTFTRLYRGVTEIRIALKNTKDKAYFHLTSDEHWDNVNCARELLKQHVEEAAALDAYWINNGDLMCLMQGKYDRRSDRTQLRPEFQGNDYLDAVARDTTDFLEPHAHRIIEIGRGNHETAILKHCQTDMTERVVGALNDRRGTSIISGGYGGWFLFRVSRGGVERKTILMFRHHGAGNASPVTKGVTVANRMGVWLPDPHLIWTGHTHDAFIIPNSRQRMSRTGRIYYDVQYHFKTPGYLCGNLDNFEGYAVEKCFAPTTHGSVMLKIGYDTRNDPQTGVRRGFTYKLEPMT